MSKKKLFLASGLATIASVGLGASSVFADYNVDGNVDLYVEIEPAIAMTITGTSDDMTGCGIVNRYHDAAGATSGIVDTFDGTPGGADEVNNNTSCSKVTLSPSSFGTTSSNVKVYTNSDGGYHLSVRANSNTSLINGSYTIPTGVLASETGNQGLWSYKTDTDVSTWTAMTLIDNTITSKFEPTSGGEETNVTYGVSLTSDQAAGLYKTTLVYTATTIDGSSVNNYSVSFIAGDTEDTITNLPVNQTGRTTSSTYSYTIPTVEPERDGYNFTGYLGSDNNTYQPGDTITLTPTSANMTLTAEWSIASIFGITYMQEMTPSICASATTPTAAATTSDTTGEHDGDTSYVPETTLIDYRGTDGTGTASSPATGSNVRSYTVRKLADGNCWMSENLKLTLTNNQPVLVGTFSGGETSWTPTGDGAESDFNEAINANTKANIDGSIWYYPWYAATAGQGTQTENPTISQSICPKGWKLPNGDDNAAPSFQSLATTYNITYDASGSAKLQSAPLSYTADGYAVNGGWRQVSSYGWYWSASPKTSDSNRAYNLQFFSVGLYLRDDDNKKLGFSVRCVAIP